MIRKASNILINRFNGVCHKAPLFVLIVLQKGILQKKEPVSGWLTG
ncbi:hypothetical protein HSIEG1_2128 [Enterococcus sp. HSIEG1]|nr:hypothetical protein HSIEG1_2128 [Enterococcus sp. HSIEG1]